MSDEEYQEGSMTVAETCAWYDGKMAEIHARYDPIRNWMLRASTAVMAAGMISIAGDVLYEMFRDQDRPDIVEIVEWAERGKRLQERRLDLEKEFLANGPPFNPTGKEDTLGGVYSRAASRERIRNLEEAVELDEEGIRDVKKDSAYVAYELEVEARIKQSNRFYDGGLIAIALGLLGFLGSIGPLERRNLELARLGRESNEAVRKAEEGKGRMREESS